MAAVQSPLQEHHTLTEISDDEELHLPLSDGEEDEPAAPPQGDEGEREEEEGGPMKAEPPVGGMAVLALLDKIMGSVEHIQNTQGGLEARQRDMERAVTGIQADLAALTKTHSTTANSVSKMADKVRKVSVNVKTVRAGLERQGAHVKRLEASEAELLKRRNFKVMIYQDDVKLASKLSISRSMKVSEAASGSKGGSLLELKEASEEHQEEHEGDKEDHPPLDLSSDEEDVVTEEIVEASRAERIKRSSLQRVQTLKTVFSKEKMDKTKQKTKEKMDKTKQKTKENIEKTKQKTKENIEKTKQKTKENIEKTKQKTKENLEKTRHNIEKKMGKLGTRMSVNPEHKQKLQTSRDKVKKAFTPDHTVYARSKTDMYKVPPFTFHVKKIREGAVEVVHATEMVEVSADAEGFHEVEMQEGGVELEMEMMNGGGEEGEEEVEEEEEEEEHNQHGLVEDEEREQESD